MSGQSEVIALPPFVEFASIARLELSEETQIKYAALRASKGAT